MNEPRKWKNIAGLALHVVIGGMMLLAGSMKVMGLIPDEEKAKLGPLADQLLLIGTGEIVTAFLLVIPRTSSLGLLLTSAFWGGAICLHMRQGDAYATPAALLVLTWLGAWLRNPAILSSFTDSPAAAPRTAEEPELVSRH
jgi:hypothetical protein